MNSCPSQNVRQPSETEAWKFMMDSMIEFIAASTKLMKIINNSGGEATSATDEEVLKCKLECLLCPTRAPKECGVCLTTTNKGIEKPTKKNASTDKAKVERTKGTQSGSNVQKELDDKNKSGSDVPEKLDDKAGSQCACEEKKLCACEVGPIEKEKMKTELANKLNQAQENIISLQKEMARLQQIDALKNSQSAALYKEIMKDNNVGQNIPDAPKQWKNASNRSATKSSDANFPNDSDAFNKRPNDQCGYPCRLDDTRRY